METLNVTAAGTGSGVSATATTDAAKKGSGLTQAFLVGTGFAGGGTIVLGALELIRSEPEKAFKLLQAWGPYVFLSMFIAWAVTKIVNRGLDVVERVGVRMADAMDAGAVQLHGQSEAMRDLASATQQTADKDDRNLQEMQALTSLTAQRSEKTYAMMQAFHEDNQLILKNYQATLERIEAKVDGRMSVAGTGAEKS